MSDNPTIPEPDLGAGFSISKGTISEATKILHYINENKIFLLVDKKYVFLRPVSVDAVAPIWMAANNPEKFTIVVNYDPATNEVIWSQVRTRWASDPAWG